MPSMDRNTLIKALAKHHALVPRNRREPRIQILPFELWT